MTSTTDDFMPDRDKFLRAIGCYDHASRNPSTGKWYVDNAPATEEQQRALDRHFGPKVLVAFA